jgi:hypothetical protein
MITAETVNGIVRFQANGLPVVSLYCRVDPGASQREVRARVDSLLDQIRPLAKARDLDHRYRLSVRTDIERIKDALGGRQETASHEHRESRELTVKVIVYADFNCVYCFLASQRADRLTREGTAEVDWRAVEHLPRLPVTGYKPRPGEAQPGGEAGEDDLAEAARLALPGEHLPAGPPAVISNTRAAVSAYAEAITDGIQDRLRLRLFESIWAQGRNMSSAYDVRRVVAALLWPADPIYPHLVSPDLPTPVLHDPTRCGSYAGKAARSRPTATR